MTETVIADASTQPIGFAPILGHYYEKCGLSQIIDNHVPLDPRRKVLTHGQACVAMVTGILFQVLQLYRLCKFADETTVLDVILPGIAPEEYFDDRLADTLDALYAYGIGNLETMITRCMIDEFNIQNDLCHNDTTSASFYGDAGNNKTRESIRITFGYSKKHRQDLKQLVWSISVSNDHAFPLFQKAYSGNTADVDTYVEQWNNLIDLLEGRDFLYVADSKLITKENMTQIHNNEGAFIGPAPMYESYKNVFFQALDDHVQETLLPYKDRLNRGFEVPFEFEHEGKIYEFRMIILYDHGLFATKSHALKNRVEKCRQAFADLEPKLNQYRLKNEAAIDKRCTSILKKHKALDFFTYHIVNNPVTTYKNKKKGRPAEGAEVEKTAVVKDHFTVKLDFNQSAFEKALFRCGYYPLISNQTKDKLSMEDAMMAHKNQYKCEHFNRRAKSGYSLEPIYLQTPERIEALLLLFKIALQVVVLIERAARRNIESRDKGLDNFMPNRKDVRNPRTEYLLAEFQYIVRGEMALPDGNYYSFVSKLTPLQEDILAILEIPKKCYSYEYLFGSG